MRFRVLLILCVMIGAVLWLLNFYGSKFINWFVDGKFRLVEDRGQQISSEKIYWLWRQRCFVLEQENRELRAYIRDNLPKKETDE